MANVDPIASVTTWMRCGEQGRGPVDLAADWLAGGREPAFPGTPDRETVFTRSGREAISLAMRRWKVGPGDRVLVPAYNCGSDISPTIATGARVMMYRVDKNAEIDFDDIRRRLTGGAKVVCVTHYFGRPADIRDLATLCRAAGVKLLEDCALSLFSAGVGRIGDAAVYSLRKSLPASDGGVLTIRSSGADGAYDLGVEAARSIAARGMLALLKRWVQRRFWISAGAASFDAKEMETDDHGKSALPDIPSSYYFARDAPVVGASRLARGLLNRIDMREIIDRRRGNYHLLRGLMKDVRGFAPLWGGELLEPGVCPLGLPGLVEDRDHWRRSLNRAGVSITPWWEGFHRGLDWGEFPEARTLKERLILLPVHQGLATADMEHIAAAARSVELAAPCSG